VRHTHAVRRKPWIGDQLGTRDDVRELLEQFRIEHRDDDVAVELYADPSAGAPPLAAVRAAMAERRPLPGTAHGRVYGARVAADRPADAFTPRIVPGRADVAAAETPIVLWYR